MAPKAISRSRFNPTEPSRFQEILRTIHSSNSGYVHGAAPHIMDMFGGEPPRFHVTWVRDLYRRGMHSYNFWNYVYRGILATGHVALALGTREKCTRALALRDSFERQTNRSC